MVEQSDFPDSWARDCDEKHTRVEVSVFRGARSGINRVPDPDDFEWIEIPTSQVETWESKGESATIKRTSKIQFPTDWDGGNVREVVAGVGVDAIIYGRVSHKDDNGNWVLKHCGYVGGVGGGANELESKAWIYDFANLCKSVPVSESFNSPSIGAVAKTAGQYILEDTTIPITGITLVEPSAEEAFASFAGAESFPESGTSYYSTVDSTPFTSNIETQSIETATIETGGTLDDFADALLSPIVNKFLEKEYGIGEKRFVANRDTLIDILNWLSTRADVNWHFEPTEQGTTLLIDVLPSQRRFAQDGFTEDIQSDGVEGFERFFDGITLNQYQIHGTLTVLKNDALFETNPINTIRLSGDGKTSVLGKDVDLEGFGDAVKPLRSDEYPVVEARVDPLYQAAGEVERVGQRVESKASTVDQAKLEAARALREAVQEATEGKIDTLGNPYVKPYDVVDAYETCGDYIEQEPEPVTYEIESVKHEESMAGLYKTTLNVTVYVDETDISFPVSEVRTK